MKKIKIFNSLIKQKETLEPINPPILNIYTCGPTVYDHSHIGHARSAITWDFIVKYLRYSGYKVTWVRNITDIDDKIINKAKELNIHPDKVARIFSHSFHEDMLDLGIQWPDFEPRATQYLSQMYSFVESLIKKNYAYQIDDDVYFSISAFKKYGKLKGQTIEELEKGFGRIEPNPKKKHPLDFALWKGTKEANEYGFTSPWGRGRPGWHLECSSMNLAIFGEQTDIHTGGDDLIFPHHENEIAQSEALNGKQFAKYWLHNGMIMIDGKKMAKSEGNYITIKDVLKKTIPNALRFFVLNSHYRMPLNFTEEGILSAQNGINRLKEAIRDYEYDNQDLHAKAENEFTKEFDEVMSDDFNSPQALAVLFKLTDLINTETNIKTKKAFQKILLQLSSTLGFNLLDEVISKSLTDQIFSSLIDKLMNWRRECKDCKDYTNADKIRKILTESSIEVKDRSNDKYNWHLKV